MKNILLYTDTPQIGGAELQILLLAKFLDRKEFTPILAVSNYPQLDKWCRDVENEDVKVVRINVKHKHDPKHFFELRRIIRENDIDLLHAHVWNPASCRYAFSAAQSQKIPVVTTEHDPFKLSFLKDLVKRSQLDKIAKIITVSEENARLLRTLYPHQKAKIKAIHNGIDVAWWESQLLRFTDHDRDEIKEQIFHAKKNTLMIAAVAELHERKGLRFAIEAIPKVIEKFSNVKLVMIGEGKEYPRLSRLVKDLKLEHHVAFTGHRKEIAKLLRSSDIFLLPSRREAFGLVVAEAMIAGLPVVASRVGGIPEIVDDGKTGFLVEPENSDEIAEKLLELIGDKEKRDRMGATGYIRIKDHFDAKKMAERYGDIYKILKKS